MTEHQVLIAGAGPTGMVLAAELRLMGVDAGIIERRVSQEVAGRRAGGLHARTIELFDQRGIAGRFLAEGRIAQVAGFNAVPLDISDFPTRHPMGWRRGRRRPKKSLPGGRPSSALPSIADARSWAWSRTRPASPCR